MPTIPCTKSKENDMTIDIQTLSTIPDQFEDMFYRMNPETDDILENGSLVENGMIVLIEDHMLRESLERALKVNPDTGTIDDFYAHNRALTHNRWCRVSQVHYQRALYGNNAQITFIAEYADGSKEKRRYGRGHAWLVKLDSLPKPN